MNKEHPRTQLDRGEDETYLEARKNAVRIDHHEVPEEAYDRVWCITTLSGSRFGGICSPAVCRIYARAEEIVLTNEGDLYETCYSLVVIESVQLDVLYSANTIERWFLWVGDYATGKYVPIQKPKEFESSYGWGVG